MPTKLLAACSLLLASLLIPASPLLAQEESADALQDIASEMNSAAAHLAKLRTGAPTQTAQQNALKKIDQLIAELERQRNAGRGSGGGGLRPATDSTIITGPGGMGKLHAERRDGKQWGELPAKERERILQSLNEGFPSHYQVILERYFARLADEKPAADLAAPDELSKPQTKGSPAPAVDKATMAKEKP
jgi:hypothetical protein